MMLVILGISVLLLICGLLIFNNVSEDIGFVLGLSSGIVVFVSIVACLVLSGEIINLSIIEDEIEMYEQENSRIETQVAETVKQYQEYEKEIFTDVSPESYITLVSLYPELKADTLVQKQIEIYIANNEKIKSLKHTQIQGDVLRWWLYFGGNI